MAEKKKKKSKKEESVSSVMDKAFREELDKPRHKSIRRPISRRSR